MPFRTDSAPSRDLYYRNINVAADGHMNPTSIITMRERLGAVVAAIEHVAMRDAPIPFKRGTAAIRASDVIFSAGLLPAISVIPHSDLLNAKAALCPSPEGGYAWDVGKTRRKWTRFSAEKAKRKS